jgi:hypothetical protein
MSTGNRTNFKALLLAVNRPRGGYSKHYAPFTVSQCMHADGNDSVSWGQPQTMRHKNIHSTNLILKPMAVLLDIDNT